MQVCVSKRTQVYPLPMKYERAGMCNTQRNCGSIAERIVVLEYGARADGGGRAEGRRRDADDAQPCQKYDLDDALL